jgi:hypothetical protein
MEPVLSPLYREEAEVQDQVDLQQNWAWNPHLPVSKPSPAFRRTLPFPTSVLSISLHTCLLVKVILEKHYFICGHPLTFIPREQVCDGQPDCALGEDEEHCIKDFPERPSVAGKSRG